MEKFDISNSLKKSGWLFTLAMLGVVIASVVYSILSLVINIFHPTKLAAFAIPQIILPITVLLFVAFCVRRFFQDNPKEVFGLKKISAKQVLFSLILGVALYFVTNFIGSIITALLDGLNFGGNIDDKLPAINSLPVFILMMFVMCILPAISEELVYRAAIMNYAKPAGMVFAIIFSGLCFGFMHCNFYQLLYAIIAGLIFALVYFKTKNIIIVVIAHFVNNLITLFRMYLLEGFDIGLKGLFFGISLIDIIMFVLSAAFLIFLFFATKNVSHETTENSKVEEPLDHGTPKDAFSKAAIGFCFCIVMAIITALM